MTIETLTPYLVVAIGAVVGWITYKRKLQNEATSVAISYSCTIAAINASLKAVQDNVLDDAIEVLMALPSNKVRDYRNEDWFDVHRALTDRLGYLCYLDETEGAKANRKVMEFFNNLKYVRDTWSYLIMLAGAAKPASSKAEEHDSATILVREVIEKKMELLRKKLRELITLGDETVDILDKLTHLKPGRPTR